MFQGTSSHVGKSLLTAALCRILKDDGLNVAPFKAQNMALNSFITEDGLEIGRAQAFQAEAAAIFPTVDMNPILLKPTSNVGSQVIIHGKPYGMMDAVSYHSFKREAFQYVLESYRKLSEKYDVIVIEGAGSPAEINLRDGDIVNMGLAEAVDAPVVLIGDIDRGGVFAFLIGTLELLSSKERARVKGIIINKFRGDVSLLKSGIEFLERRSGIPVLGIIPYLDVINLPDEDGVSLERIERQCIPADKGIHIIVVRLPRIANFTDIDPFRLEPDVSIQYVNTPGSIDGADMVVIPGSKNTIGDLLWLKEMGIDKAIAGYVKKGKRVVGICGGFQMLGRTVKDPYAMESNLEMATGLGLLDVETIMKTKKDRYQVQVVPQLMAEKGVQVTGYEIHMGETESNEDPFSIITERNNRPVEIYDGAVSKDGMVWGTYVHGIFDNDTFRMNLLNELRASKGLPLRGEVSFRERREQSIQTMAEKVRSNLNMEKIYGILYKG